MSKEQIESIFTNYVYGFIQADIEREIWLARQADSDVAAGRQRPGGGNVLAALGLVCYTDFLGSFITGQKSASMDNFLKFLERMGDCYKEALASIGRGRTYGVFRCGLAHEYAVKGDCTIFMLKGEEQCGVGGDDNGQYYVVVERYFEDFMGAARQLYAELLDTPVVPK